MAAGDKAASVIEQRLMRGDYRLTGVPAERELARDVGVSRMTARKALARLVDRGVLQRLPNGRVEPRTDSGPLSELTQVAILRPANGVPTPILDLLARLGPEWNVRVRPIEFVHWHDPIVGQSLDSFDGVLIQPPAEPIPADVLDKFRSSPAPVVVIDRDLAEHGVRCIDTCPPGQVHQLLDHLYRLGHRRIACFNTQPRDEIIQARLAAWAVWKAAQRVEGPLIDEPVESYDDPAEAAYAAMNRCLGGVGLDATAVLCITTPAAVAAMRCCHERGLAVGRDLSIVAVDDQGLNRYLTPSLTCLRPPDPTPYLRVCLQWFAQGGEPGDWPGPLALKPDEVSLFCGESSGSPVSS